MGDSSRCCLVPYNNGRSARYGFSGDTSTRRWEIVIPVLALIVLGYTIYRNVIPYPTGEAGWNPAICAVWLLLAVVLVLARPAIARRAGERLTADQGLAPTREPA